MSKSKQNKPRHTDGSTTQSGTRSTAPVSRRERLRAQQAAEAQRARTRRILIVVTAIVAAAIVAVVTTVLVQNHNRRKAEERQRNQAAQMVPPNATADGTAIGYAGGEAAGDVPDVVAYLDFQCPGCSQSSKLIDPLLEQLADQGRIRLTYHILYGLDSLLNTDHSFRAAVAASCADFQGKFPEYTSAVFANQPAKEGDGWTDAQLLQWAGQAGIEGDQKNAFETCFTTQATSQFVQKMQRAKPDSVTGTPTFLANGKPMGPTKSDLVSADALLAKILQAAGS